MFDRFFEKVGNPIGDAVYDCECIFREGLERLK